MWCRYAIRALQLIACLALAQWFGGTAAVQGQDIPPFPILYGGRVYIDGDPAPEGTKLVARVDDYEIWTHVGPDGIYRNLVVGPPSEDYHFAPITFHVDGLQAEETDAFLPSETPTSKDRGFDLHFHTAETWASPSPTPPVMTVTAPSGHPSPQRPTASPTPSGAEARTGPTETASSGKGNDAGIPLVPLGVIAVGSGMLLTAAVLYLRRR